MDWSFVLSVVIIGLVVVFAVLLFLIAVVVGVGKLFQKLESNRQKKLAQETLVATESEKISSAEPIALAQEDGLTEDVVAAITAAIQSVLASEGNVKPFAIKSIRTTKSGRNTWNMAGVTENTYAF